MEVLQGVVEHDLLLVGGRYDHETVAGVWAD